MEIERKFLIDGFPQNLEEKERADVYQGYICTNPVVRIRKKITENAESYVLCFKGKGSLQREETEFDIEREKFEKLCELLSHDMIHKDYRTYYLGDYILECSKVDYKGENIFYYAEVEFKTLSEAKAFTPPEFLGEDVTEKKGYSMKNYWERIQIK